MHDLSSTPHDAVRTLHTLAVLEAPADPVLDGMVRCAAAVLDCPIAAVSLLVDGRLWVKASSGIDATDVPAEGTICAETVRSDGLFEVPDAARDPRFTDFPAVLGAPHVRFYAGMPLRVSGVVVGTVCVVDMRPRQLDPTHRALLADVARAVEHWLLSWEQQRALRAAEAYRRSLFEQLGDGVLIFDQRPRVCDANPHALETLGYTLDELRQLRPQDLVAPSERSRLEHELPAMASGTPHVSEWTYVRKDGTQFPTEVCVRRLDDGHFIAVSRDISVRQAQDQQLRQLSMAVEQGSESIVITDVDGNIEYVNAAACTTTGYTRAELLGRNPRFMHAPESAAATYRAMWDDLGDGRTWRGQLRNHRKDGSTYYAMAAITPIRDAQGDVTHYLTVMEDVTEKRRLSEELERYRQSLEERVQQRTAELEQARQVAEEANRAKSAFLATMSHEIRTPMNGVVGIVDVLRQSSLNSYQTDLADTIRESAFALLGIIDDILDFSKIEADRLELESEPVALLRLVEAVCDGLQPVAASAGVTLCTFVDPRVPAWVLSDAVRLRQILNNLVGNAIKFCAGLEHPGRVQIRVTPDADGWVQLLVRDNGIGMSAETQQRVFEPFVQAESATTRRYGGTGLGLSICSRLVGLFGGTIGVVSEPGAGSTFAVRLPLPASAVDDPRKLPPLLGGLRCLIVSADHQQAADWSAYLCDAGATPLVCDGLDAARNAVDGQQSVLLAATDPAQAEPAWLRGLEATLPSVRVTHGLLREQRRNARVVGPGRVVLESAVIHRDTLLHAIALAVGRSAPVAETALGYSATNPATVPDADAAAAMGRLILVAEDNEINQKVIRRQLALLGLAVEMSDDGLDALALWRAGRDTQRHSLLLTDLNMPRMDGYQLATAIRFEEAAGTRMPIVALTANALRDEIDRCRAVGMDDCLSKPVQLAQLGATLGRWLAAQRLQAAPAAAPTSDSAPEPALYDPSVLGGLIGDDPDTIAAFGRDFVVAANAAARELRQAFRHGDRRALTAVAHRLKSSARAMGAMALGSACERLEALPLDATSDQADTLLRRFEALLGETIQVLVPAAALPAGPRDEPSVIVVDDEPFQLRVVERQLAMLGVAAVHTFSSGADVLRWLQGRDSSGCLMLVDLNMPVMDGVELIRHLAEENYTGSLSLLSGADVRVLETATKLAGAYQLNVLGHLHKPVPSDRLNALIERWRRFSPARAVRVAKAYDPHDIARAIHGGELVLHYQPKVALSDGRWVGVEALVRWQHPSDGLVYPDSFIGVAEANRLIDDLTRAVLTQAIAQARCWRDAGRALQVSVNVSMDNLANLDFPGVVKAMLEAHGVAPADLMLEVTESRLMQDVRAPMDILTRLRLKRIGLSIDDFGTGHSSLAQLRDIPFDELKIDRGFVHGSRDHPTQRAIFSASLEMAHQLGMLAVAEGVEDREDWDFVRAAGCDVAQGWFIARPMAPEALIAWADEWRARMEAM